MICRPLAWLAALGLLAAPAQAPAAPQPGGYPPMPKAGPPKPFAVPASETYRLPNGMQVTLVPYGIVPKVYVSLRLYASSLDEGKDTGLVTLTALMLREGAAGRTNAQIAAAAAAMGGGIGTSSGSNETSINLNVLSEHGAEAVRLVGDLATHADFPASEFERVKTGWARNIAVGKSQPQAMAQSALLAAYYGKDHPYGRLYPTDAQVKGYTLADVRRFYAANYGARRARLYVAGRFDSAAVKAAIAQAFGGWQPGPERLRLPPTPQPGPRVILVDRPGAAQSTVRLAWPAPRAGSASDIPFEVTDALLGGSFTSRITHNIREVKGYTYSPFSTILFHPDEATWQFNADITTDVTGPALKEVFGEIRRLQTEPVPEQEATGIRTWLAGTFILQNANAPGIAGSLAERDFYGLPSDWIDRYVPNVLAVGGADMQRLARDTLPLDKATLVVVGDLAKIEPQLKALPELQGVTFQRVTPF